MPRAPRQLASGEAYHLTSRGTNKCDVFLDDSDRRDFVRRLGTVASHRRVSCLAYCLMGNHIHLILQGSAAGMSATMRDLLGGYAQWFNVRHARSGHLFGARYNDVHIESDAQMHAALRYVALNPVRANLVNDPNDWAWGSFAAVMGGAVQPGTVDLVALASILGSARGGIDGVRERLVETVDVGLAAARADAVRARAR
jgi:putative transposase